MSTYSIVPAAGKSSLILLGLFVFVLLVVAFAASTIGRAYWAAHAARFDVDHAGLHIHGEWLYRSEVPRSAWRASEARVVDLRVEPALRPARRTMGTGLPGYQGGWFRLRNGEKALVYVTEPRKAVYLPTTLGFSVLLTVTDPEGLLASLRSP